MCYPAFQLIDFGHKEKFPSISLNMMQGQFNHRGHTLTSREDIVVTNRRGTEICVESLKEVKSRKLPHLVKTNFGRSGSKTVKPNGKFLP